MGLVCPGPRAFIKRGTFIATAGRVQANWGSTYLTCQAVLTKQETTEGKTLGQKHRKGCVGSQPFSAIIDRRADICTFPWDQTPENKLWHT